MRLSSLAIILPALAVLSVLASGCAAPNAAAGGAGPADPVYDNARRINDASFAAVDEFLGLEHDLRDVMRQRVPQVHAAAEWLRANAKGAFRDADDALAAYALAAAAQKPAAADTLERRLERVQNFARAARLWISRIYAAAPGSAPAPAPAATAATTRPARRAA